ncbi:MAG: mercuric ion binding protein [Oceanospirillaceae bacterium]|jgi:mercuric ion binding protein
MLRILSVLMLLFVVNTSSLAQSSKKLVIKTSFNCINCSKCENCGGRFESEFSRSKGVISFKLDDKKMEVKVTYDPKRTNPNRIRLAIARLGYNADAVKADPKGFANLVGCCKP